MKIGYRLMPAPGIDFNKPVQFSFNGKRYQGYQGDTLASALLANGVKVIARSSKFHRPRGIFAAGAEEANAIVRVENGAKLEVNVRATQLEIYEGLIASSQNCWPSVNFDIGVINDGLANFLPAGFYYKTFIWPNWHWYEHIIRRAAGLGRAGDRSDEDFYVKRNIHCDVLIIGGGAAGIAAALTAAHSGAKLILIDEQSALGGSLLWETGRINAGMPMHWVERSLKQLSSMDNVTLLPRTIAQGYYEHNYVVAQQQLVDSSLNSGSDSMPRQRLWKIRAGEVILATGAIERPLVFPNNDRPGIMLASAARVYLNRYGVEPGPRVVLFTNNDSAYYTALDLHKSGRHVVTIIDVREAPDASVVQKAIYKGMDVRHGCVVSNTKGRTGIRSVQVTRLRQGSQCLSEKDTQTIECDLLCMSGGWNPAVHLFSQAGGSLQFDDEMLCFVPAQCHQRVRVAGSANGRFLLHECLKDGYEQGIAAAQAAGFSPDSGLTQAVIEQVTQTPVCAYWQTPTIDTDETEHRQWVDFLHDVTVADIALAARENFRSVEHLKRYTTVGMGLDQGKTSNVNALAIMGELSDRTVTEVGTTKFRPPYQPVTIGVLAGDRVAVLSHRYRRLPVGWHSENNAVFEDHSGWLRPAYYPRQDELMGAAIRREVSAARNGVALFDSSSLGKIEVRGPDAAEFLNRLYINNVKTLQPGRVRYGMMLNENGTIMDDGVFACLADEHYLVMTSSAGTQLITAWMEEWLQCEWPDMEVVIVPVTAQWATLTVSGPKARELLTGLGMNIDLSQSAFPHMSLQCSELDGIPVRLFRVSFTGELSYEVNIPCSYADSLWRLLLEQGQPYDVTAIGMEALDILRIEKAYLEVGVDTDADTSPLDVGWRAAIDRKTDDFIGRRSLQRQHDQRSDRLQLVGLKPLDKLSHIPVGSHVLDKGNDAVFGHVTSSCLSPTLNESLAMAMIAGGATRKGETVQVDIDGKLLPAHITELGFYDSKGERFNG